MESPQIDLRPRDVPEHVWDALPAGRRVRFVRNNQYSLELTPGQYAELYRLPYWMLYGPEHGAPADWFNPDGYLLPKFRPGGGRFSEFRSWRRTLRSRRWLHYRIRERYRSLRERFKTLYSIGGIVGYLIILSVCWRLERRWFGEEVGFFPMVGMMLLIYVGGLILLIRFQITIVKRRVEKRWKKREDS